WRLLLAQQFLELGFGRGDVGVEGFVEQRALFGIELLALLAELQTPQLCDLERELLQLHIAPVDLPAIMLDAAKQLGADLAETRRFQRGELFGGDGRVCTHGCAVCAAPRMLTIGARTDCLQVRQTTPASATRCQGRPSTRASSCSRVRDCGAPQPPPGQTKRPWCSRRAASQMPMPSCTSTFSRVERLLAKT